jgi:hypothetical protein
MLLLYAINVLLSLIITTCARDSVGCLFEEYATESQGSRLRAGRELWRKVDELLNEFHVHHGRRGTLVRIFGVFRTGKQRLKFFDDLHRLHVFFGRVRSSLKWGERASSTLKKLGGGAEGLSEGLSRRQRGCDGG